MRRRAAFLEPMRFDTSMAIKPERSSRAKTAIPAMAPQLIPPSPGVGVGVDVGVAWGVVEAGGVVGVAVGSVGEVVPSVDVGVGAEVPSVDVGVGVGVEALASVGVAVGRASTCRLKLVTSFCAMKMSVSSARPPLT